MKKLSITAKMNHAEQQARMTINHAIEHVSNPDELKNWLIDQVIGVEIDGVTYTYPWLTYDEALNYFNEATA